MFKYWLSIFLVALVALQSVVAMADSQQNQQSRDQHLEVNSDQNFADYGNLALEMPDASLSADPADCDQCCHCHGVACVAIVSNYAEQVVHMSMLTQSGYALFFPSDTPAPPFRPPIV